MLRAHFQRPLNFAGVPLVPGTPVRADMPLSKVERSYVEEGGNAAPSHTVAVIAVPHGFGPTKAWPVLVIFSSSEVFDNSHVLVPAQVREAFR